MRVVLSIVACVAATWVEPAAAASFPLQPIGLPFWPDSPKPVSPDHPLYRQIALDPVADMPNKVGKFLIPITSAKEMNDALRETLERANMLAPPGAQPKAHLVVRWVGLSAPQRISSSSEATAILSYTLIRSSSGEQLFRRDISTSARSEGGEASDRLKGTARLALMTNLASAVVCLDKGALGRAPADCALQSGATYRARSPAIVTPIFRR